REPSGPLRAEPIGVPRGTRERLQLRPLGLTCAQELVDAHVRASDRGRYAPTIAVLLDDRLTIETPEGVAIDLALAGLGSRILARLLDSLVQYGALYVLQIVFSVGATLGPTHGVNGWLVAVI